MIVIDSNIVFSALLSSNSRFLGVLLDEKNKFIAPHFLFIELFRHKEKIIRFSKLDESELLELLNQITSNINFISHKTISARSMRTAYDLCVNVDLKDAVFVALTIEFNGSLWTGDKKLIEGLRGKGYDQFFDI